MKLSDLRNMRVLIWGAGREGSDAARILLAQNCIIAFITDQPDTDTETHHVATQLSCAVLSPADIESWKPEYIVRSPGVSRYRTELQNFPSSSLLALWLADQDPQRIIGVTGTKGKSTTATLIANILAAAGHNVEVAGNIGIPVTQTSSSSDFIVVEVSSYQASDCTTSPFIGVLTSLDVDHIPWHGTIEKYHHDKLNLFAHSELEHMVCHNDNANAMNRLTELGVAPRRFSNSQHSVHVALATPQGEAVISRMGNTTFPKNLELAMDAALAADNALTLAHVLAALDNTQPLPSRQNFVGEAAGRIFVDDALASNPLGVIAALQRFDSSRFVLIMGGEERDVDYSSLCDAINESRHLVAIVALGGLETRLHKALLTTKATIQPVNSDNVADALSHAISLSQPGDVIVFSPGAPTPRALGDYRDRSNQFVAGISGLRL